MKKNIIIKKYILITMVLLGTFLYLKSNLFADAPKDDNKRKMVLICLDGATWNLMGPLLEKDQLPNFAKLIKNGVSGKLFAEQGYAYSPPSWASIATGKKAEKHGIYNFSDGHKRKAKYIWQILGDFDIKIAAINWLMNLPERVNGIMYIRSWYENKHYPTYYPATIEAEIKKAVKFVEIPPFESTKGYKFWNAIDKNIINISMYIIKKHPPSFVAIGFDGTNPYQHRYWSALEPQYFDISLEEVKEKGNLIVDYYKKIDTFLSYFLKNNYTIIFVSDHGFCRNDIRSGIRIAKYYHLNSDMQHINFLVNRLLEKIGMLVFIPKLEGGGQIDFSKSQAYFFNNIKLGICGIKINREIVKKDEIEGLTKRLYLLLKEAHFENGQRAFTDVKENISKGRIDMPDITFNLSPIFKKENIFFREGTKDNPSYLIFTFLLDKDSKRLTKILLENKEYNLGDFIDYSRDGVHEPDGVIIMAGRNIKKNMQIEDAKNLDITPTILYLLGLPIAKDMDGEVLIEAIEPGFVKSNPIKYIDTYELKDGEMKPEEGLHKQEIMKERLRSLGYAQ